MLITNGKKIVTLPHDPDKLQEIADTLKKRAKDNLGLKGVKFELQTEPFPHLLNVKELSFEELQAICKPDMDIQFRAIGDERVQLPAKKIKDIKHTFNDEEKMKIADNLCDTQFEKEKVEAEKKDVVKQYSQRIEGMETSISELANKHRQGYEIRTETVFLHLDFENKVRVYTHVETGAILHQEPLEAIDYQMRIEWKENEFAEVAADDSKFVNDELEKDREKIIQMEEVIVEKNKSLEETDAEFPFLLDVADTSYMYADEAGRDEDYDLALKVFKVKK